jgi:hypothetical protein
MSDTTDPRNSVKPALRAKRAKRTTENGEFDAFVRRILRAYGRRVASGDVEALRALNTLQAELDATLRLAVAGLRGGDRPYSWQEIADRLGVSRQAVHLRYGDRNEAGRLDRRLIAAGLSITVTTLVEVFRDHHPGTPAASACPGCGYRYPDGMTDCPTNQTVRPLLRHRRNEDKHAVDLLNADQLADLIDKKTARANRTAARQAASPTPRPDAPPSLLDLCDGKDVA